MCFSGSHVFHLERSIIKINERANESRYLLRRPSFPFDQIFRFSLERKVARDLLLDGTGATRCVCFFDEQTAIRHPLDKVLSISSQ